MDASNAQAEAWQHESGDARAGPVPASAGDQLHRRIQRYGWDLAASRYDALWAEPLSDVRARLLDLASLLPGENVLDVACGTGLLSFASASAVGEGGEVAGIDLSGRMIDAARQRARLAGTGNVRFTRMDAEFLCFPDASFDAIVCAFGLMYVANPMRALRAMARALRPGGRLAMALWGRASKCEWSGVMRIVANEAAYEACPRFFSLGEGDSLSRLLGAAGLESITERRIAIELEFADAREACDAVLLGGPIALAWTRFDDETRARVRSRYLESIAPWRDGKAYRIPSEIVLIDATAPE